MSPPATWTVPRAAPLAALHRAQPPGNLRGDRDPRFLADGPTRRPPSRPGRRPIAYRRVGRGMNDLSRAQPPKPNPPAKPPERPQRLPASLRRNAPLVPVDSAGGRALAAVIAILTFLAALYAGGAELVSSSSSQWRSDVAREVTIQVRPHAQRSIDADVETAARLARQTPGVESAQAFTKEESERLLEPWLGTGLD